MSEDDEGLHRLARDPRRTDGLSPAKTDERGRDGGERRPSQAPKPYTSEDESYREGPQQPPDHPDQRGEADVPPRR